MAVEQRDVYSCPPPYGSKENHPFIVLSVRACNDHERTFVGVMITSEPKYHDEYSFDLSDSMFEKPLKYEKCHVRMHIFTLLLHEEIEGSRKNKMKEHYFQQLMKTIGELVFNYDIIPLQNT